MLESVLGRPIRNLKLLDTEVRGDMIDDKRVIFDIRAVIDDARIDVEMQIHAHQALIPRFVFYCTQEHSSQLTRGNTYKELVPTIVIVWLVQPIFDTIHKLHSIFELRERDTHVLLSDQLAIHVLQLSQLASAPPGEDEEFEYYVPTEYALAVERWARFLLANDAEMEQLASEDPTMSIAKQNLDKLSQDPDVQRSARKREADIYFYNVELATSREEGEKKGIEKGEKKYATQMLANLLQLRFRDLPESTRLRIEKASVDQLKSWTERVLTASTLDEVFA